MNYTLFNEILFFEIWSSLNHYSVTYRSQDDDESQLERSLLNASACSKILPIIGNQSEKRKRW
jgi:hypothetical protein